MEQLTARLRRIDGRGYKAYQDLRGEYVFAGFRLFVDHVQGDPFAAPSRVALVVDAPEAGLPQEAWSNPVRRVATEDWLLRKVARALPRVCRGDRGSGKSGRVQVDAPGQEVMERTACLVDDGGIEIRLTVGLPAAGRRVLGREAHAILCEELPALVRQCLLAGSHDEAALRRHCDVIEDQDALRRELPDHGLVAFIGRGARLARRSGVDDRPLEAGQVGFEPIPESLRVTLDTPYGGPVEGLGIPTGVTLIVGGGYHGKSTLLDGIARGIFDHVPGDGREQVVTRRDAVTTRAEDGRSVSGVGIDAFIGDLPNGASTRTFSTERASGSTSQAAGIMEALEAGAGVLLLDEDTSASNFLVRDSRMQRLVPPDREPIRPLVDRVRRLWSEHAVSTVMVLGGSSDYFEEANCVVQMDAYRPRDVTAAVRALMDEMPSQRQREVGDEPVVVRDRVVMRAGLDPSTRRGRTKIRAQNTRAILLGEQEIDVSLVGQLVCSSQTRAIGDALGLVWRELADDRRTMREITAELSAIIQRNGLVGIAAPRVGDRAAVRALDIAAAMNRLRTLRVQAAAPERNGDDET